MKPGKPKAVRNAKRIALKSYSMRANYLGAAALLAPEAIYYLWQIDTNPRFWWFIGLGLIIAGAAGRLISQDIDDDPRPEDRGRLYAPVLTIAASLFLAMAQVPDAPKPAGNNSTNYSQAEFLDVAVPLIAKWEGLRTEAYQDIVGVWTVCFGETKGVGPGDSYTKAECRAMLAREVLEYRSGWHGYLTAETLAERLHAPRDAAFTSLAYNAGVRAIGRSTATRRLNAGRIAGACDAITWWNKAGQRVVRGLVRRRQHEYRLCMRGAA